MTSSSNTKDIYKAMLSGAAAGVMEHISMFPFDTIKTRMQVFSRPGEPVYNNIVNAFSRCIKEEGFFRLYRGVSALILAAIPSHGLYFGTYEFSKRFLIGDSSTYHPIYISISGALATCAHDAVVTPMDVLKQRMQLFSSKNLSLFHTFRRIIQQETISAFYRSYPTTLLMNIPLQAFYFLSYESSKHFFQHFSLPPLANHIISGGLAGAISAFFSNPLDVVKTRIQTGHGVIGRQYTGIVQATKTIFIDEGISAFFLGMLPRVIYYIPASAICWTTYETFKKILKFNIDTHHDVHI